MNKKLNPYIIVIEDNLITETYKCKNGQEVEKKFLEVCREKISNFDDYKEEDISVILENGFEELGNKSINITWL